MGWGVEREHGAYLATGNTCLVTVPAYYQQSRALFTRSEPAPLERKQARDGSS